MAEILKFLWFLGVGVQLALLALMVVKRVYTGFPAVLAYFIVSIFQAAVMYEIYAIKGFSSWAAFYVGWISQAVLVLTRWLAVCELCRTALGQFEGIWALAWRVLLVLGVVALVVALAL